MSLILEALNKADRERGGAAAVPDLHAVHDSGPVMQPRRSHAPIIVVTMLLTLIFGYKIKNIVMLKQGNYLIVKRSTMN